MDMKILRLIKELEDEILDITSAISLLKASTRKEVPTKRLGLNLSVAPVAVRKSIAKPSKKRKYEKRSDFWKKPHPRKKANPFG
jgi:hypothetical protein